MLTVKYAPRSLKDVLNHEKVKALLKEWIEAWLRGEKRKPILLYGPPGIGKTSMAYALARDYGLEILELSASQYRDAKTLSLLRNLSFRGTLSGRPRLVLIDDLDAITKEDRGAITTLARILREASVPIIITANDAWDKKLAPIRGEVEMVEMKRIPTTLLYRYLLKIAKAEGIEDVELVKEIARRAQGDVRSALNDLEVKLPSYRQRKEDIFKTLLYIFKGKSLKAALAALAASDVDLDTLMLWLAENIPREYEKPRERAEAFHWLSRADVFNGRIKRRQYWGFLRYASALAAGGVAMAKEESYKKFTTYRYPKWLRLLTKYQQRRALAKAVAKKLSRKLHLPVPFILQNLSFYADLVARGGERARAHYNLSEEEFAFLQSLAGS